MNTITPGKKDNKAQKKIVSVQGANTKILSIPFRENISDHSGFMHQLMDALAMQAKVDGIFFTEITPY